MARVARFPMQNIHRRDLIRCGVHELDVHMLDTLVAQLVDAELAREILRTKGYGATGMNASTTAAQVPCAPRKE